MEIQLVLNGEESVLTRFEDVQALLANGDATLEDYAWFDGCADWITIAEIPGISDSSGEEIEAEDPEAPSTEKMPTSMFGQTEQRTGSSKYTRVCTANDCKRRSCRNGLRCF